jgi:hypothetical protein
MDRKVLVMLLLISASLLVAGCADRKNAPGPTITPTTVASPTIQATITPSGDLNLDPSLADISGGEDNDLTGFPETGLPTPTLD